MRWRSTSTSKPKVPDGCRRSGRRGGSLNTEAANQDHEFVISVQGPKRCLHFPTESKKTDRCAASSRLALPCGCRHCEESSFSDLVGAIGEALPEQTGDHDGEVSHRCRAQGGKRPSEKQVGKDHHKRQDRRKRQDSESWERGEGSRPGEGRPAADPPKQVTPSQVTPSQVTRSEAVPRHGERKQFAMSPDAMSPDEGGRRQAATRQSLTHAC